MSSTLASLRIQAFQGNSFSKVDRMMALDKDDEGRTYGLMVIVAHAQFSGG